MTSGPEQPISWLLLEQYAFGELSDEARAKVTAGIASSVETRQCLELIREQEERALPPLELATTAGEDPPEPALASLRRWWLGGGLVVAAGAAAIFLYLASGSQSPGAATTPDRRTTIKGGAEAVLGLVRERNGDISHDPTLFAAGDRFKVVITCSRESTLHGELLILQDGESFFPLAPVALECGNRSVIPGAFTLTGDTPAIVCFAFDEKRAPERELLSRHGPEATTSVCMELRPADSRP